MFDILSDGRDWAVVRKAKEAQKKHTLKQIIEWGKEPCFHSGITAYDVSIGAELPKKHTCLKCWAELQKEVEK